MDYDILHGQVTSTTASIWYVSFMLSPKMRHWSDSKILECLKNYIAQSRVWVGEYETKQRWCFSIGVQVSQEQILLKGGFVETLALEEAAHLIDLWIERGAIPHRQKLFGLF